MDSSIWISSIALLVACISLLYARNARQFMLAQRRSNTLTRTLLKAKEVELEWQSVLNELLQFIGKFESGKMIVEKSIKVDQLNTYLYKLKDAFTKSHQSAVDIRFRIEKDIQTMTEEEAEDYLEEFSKGQANLQTTRDEMVKKLSLLAESIQASSRH